MKASELPEIATVEIAAYAGVAVPKAIATHMHTPEGICFLTRGIMEASFVL
jgi:hypothetical protein